MESWFKTDETTHELFLKVKLLIRRRDREHTNIKTYQLRRVVLKDEVDKVCRVFMSTLMKELESDPKTDSIEVLGIYPFLAFTFQ